MLACSSIKKTLLKYTRNVTSMSRLELLKKRANDNHIDAQRDLGLLYVSNNEIKCDYKEGIKLLNKAYDQGCKISGSTIGTLYLHGAGIEPDIKKGVKMIHENDPQPDIHLLNIYKKAVTLQLCLTTSVENMHIVLESITDPLYKSRMQRLRAAAHLGDKDAQKYITDLYIKTQETLDHLNVYLHDK
jgi:TPR repeat protein